MIPQPTPAQPYVQHVSEEQVQFTTQQQFDIKTLSPVFTVQDKLIEHINIPDQVNFEHKLSVSELCIGNGERVIRSEFGIPGLGEFAFQLTQKFYCYSKCEWTLNCDYHEYPYIIYSLSNRAIQMEYKKQGVGRILIDGRPIIDFNQTQPNYCDMMCAHWCSSHPKILISFPFEQNKKLELRPDKNLLPETCQLPCCCLGWFQLCKYSRNYHVEGLTQGNCHIVNTRDFCHAYARCGMLQGSNICNCCCCCCTICCLCCKYPYSDYPRYTVIFENVRQIDKIAILMCLMHHSFYQEWCGNQTQEEPQITYKPDI